jgi:hypothetical protein
MDLGTIAGHITNFIFVLCTNQDLAHRAVLKYGSFNRGSPEAPEISIMSPDFHGTLLPAPVLSRPPYPAPVKGSAVPVGPRLGGCTMWCVLKPRTPRAQTSNVHLASIQDFQHRFCSIECLLPKSWSKLPSNLEDRGTLWGFQKTQ